VGAERVEAPKGVGSGDIEGAVPEEKIFFKFQYKMLQFGAFWCLLQAILQFIVSRFIRCYIDVSKKCK